MHKIILILAAPLCFYFPLANAMVINSTGTAVLEDFSGFTGSGFQSMPAAGQLDSDVWRVTGLSDGDGSFGATHLSGDFARGTSSGAVSGGGVWGFDVDNGAGVNRALGVQPTGSDFSPGSISLRVTNATGNALTSLLVSYDIFVLNDAARSSSFNFSYSLDDSAYMAVPANDLVSNGAADSVPEWSQNSFSTLLTGLNILDSTPLYLQWSSNDAGGSRSRDQFALDNISITGFSENLTAVPEPEAWVLMALGLLAMAVNIRGGRFKRFG